MLNILPITCLLVGIGSGINTPAEDYPAKVQRFENALNGRKLLVQSCVPSSLSAQSSAG
jgi:hypothetical protein